MARAKHYGSRRGNAKTSRTYPKQSVSITFDNNIKEQLDKFTSRLKEEAFNPAAYAGVTVIYDELQIRAPEFSGVLKDAMYRWRDRNEYQFSATYYAGVNKRKAPHWWLVEHGHWQYYAVTFIDEGIGAGQWVTLKDKPLAQPRFVPAQPYLRPTADAKMQIAMQAAMQVLKERVKGMLRGESYAKTTELY